ncbi:3-oxoacyl-[acyl-carrier-protein] synthase, mitochondrial-like [Artemia franciscana]|uniref:3-oxoacyl-[acyl-carrier-protein] synthase, mitochondrial-like n=1 Tax=Artemia franciscana TaxID=6661 RepID=UPI0032DBF380
MNRSVVVTGIGLVTPLGTSKLETWNNLINSVCGISKLEGEQFEKLPCKVAGLVPKTLSSEHIFKPHELRHVNKGTVYALHAAHEAVKDSKLELENSDIKSRVGVTVGMGMTEMDYIYETGKILETKGPSRVSPFFIPRILTNMAAGLISIKYGANGPNHSVSTACATGLHSVGDAFRIIKYGDADAMICGSAEACIYPLSLAGFSKARALATKFNDCPWKASRPFDSKRDGFVMGEGAGIIVLEEAEHARKRGARIYSEILGKSLLHFVYSVAFSCPSSLTCRLYFIS